MVRANPAGGLTQIWRDGSSWVWSVGSNLVATDSTGKPQVGQYVNGQPSMLGSSFNRDFEVLFWGDSGTLNHWYYSETHGGWYFTGQLNYPTGAVQNSFSGYPGFVETDDSNFAIVVRNSDGSLWEVSCPYAEARRESLIGIVTTQHQNRCLHVRSRDLWSSQCPSIRARTRTIQRRPGPE